MALNAFQSRLHTALGHYYRYPLHRTQIGRLAPDHFVGQSSSCHGTRNHYDITKSVSFATTTSSKRPQGFFQRFRSNAPSNKNYQYEYQHNQAPPRITTTGPLDYARFGLLSIATLPFSLWIATYAYEYYYRIDHCRQALTQNDGSSSHSTLDNNNNPEKSSSASSSSRLIGRDQQLSQVLNLLSNRPRQIIVVAGANESGKSRFVAELIQTLQQTRESQGVTYIQLAQIVDSLSTLTHAIVRSFSLKWLQMRHALVDVLPFAGSEILVMKERFSDRDLVQALLVVTEALKEHQREQRQRKQPVLLPVIIVDGLGEGSAYSGWIRRSPDGRKSLQRLLQWCIYITKECGLAHVILTGNEELVISLTNQNKMTRGHVKVIGLGDLDVSDLLNTTTARGYKDYTRHPASQIILQEWPDATLEEIQKMTETFGGFIHDLHSTGRQIQYELDNFGNNNNHKHKHKHNKTSKTERARIVDQVLSSMFRQQVERVTAAFAKGTEEDEDANDEASLWRQSHSFNRDNGLEEEDDDMDPYLDPLKEVYSEAQASQNDAGNAGDEDSSDSSFGKASWSQLQLWQTLQRLVESDDMTVPFADLRDDVFHGDMTALLDLMNEDVLGFEVLDHGSASSNNSSLLRVRDASSSGGGNVMAGWWSWQVKPATPALGRVFQYLVHDSQLRERFLEIQHVSKRKDMLQDNESDRRALRRERRRLDMRKFSLLKTVELGNVLDMDRDENDPLACNQLKDVYRTIIAEEIAIEKRGLELRRARKSLLEAATSPTSKSDQDDNNIKNEEHLKNTNNQTSTEPVDGPSQPFPDHGSIQKQVSAAILNICATPTSDEETDDVASNYNDKAASFQSSRKQFETLAKSSPQDGITATDLIRVIKQSTGEELDLQAANSFIKAWDANNDNHLDYDEFANMLLSSTNPSKKATTLGSPKPQRKHNQKRMTKETTKRQRRRKSLHGARNTSGTLPRSEDVVAAVSTSFVASKQDLKQPKKSNGKL